MKFNLKAFAKRAYEEAMDEGITTNAAQVAFYFIFALFPLLLFLLSVIGLFLGAAEDVRRELFAYLQQIIPGFGFDSDSGYFNRSRRRRRRRQIDFRRTHRALVGFSRNRQYQNRSQRRLRSRRNATVVEIQAHFAAFNFGYCAIDFLRARHRVLRLAVYQFAADTTGVSISSPIILNVFSFVTIGIALILSFALIYNFAPNHTPFTWKWITPGAITAIVLWLLFSGGFKIYLQYFDSYSKTYGSVGAIIVLLLWLYLTALVILIGGIINYVADELSEDKTDESKIDETKSSG